MFWRLNRSSSGWDRSVMSRREEVVVGRNVYKGTKARCEGQDMLWKMFCILFHGLGCERSLKVREVVHEGGAIIVQFCFGKMSLWIVCNMERSKEHVGRVKLPERKFANLNYGCTSDLRNGQIYEFKLKSIEWLWEKRDSREPTWLTRKLVGLIDW